MVSESGLLQLACEGRLMLLDDLSVVYRSAFQVLDVNRILKSVTDSLLKRDTVIITEQDRIVDNRTDIDVLNFVSSKGQY